MKKSSQIDYSSLFNGWQMGFEPTTNGTTIHYSNQLSYSHRLITLQKYDKYWYGANFFTKKSRIFT